MGLVRLLPSLVVLMTLQGCTGPDPASGYQEDPEALARGESVFAGTCSGYCHGMNVTIADVPNLFDCTWMHGGSNQDIYNTIATGSPAHVWSPSLADCRTATKTSGRSSRI